ncbi:unnamed protein product, partial [marine sediment metagenome]
GDFFAPCTITLIRDSSERYNLVDTGSFGEERTIKELLNKRNITPDQIQRVLITHNHPDHIGTIGLFKEAEVYMPDSKFRVNVPNIFRLVHEDFMSEVGREQKIEGSNMSLISTPGHAGWDMSILYQARNGKKIAMVGDLFWSQQDWDNNSEYLNLCVNKAMQDKSRDYVRNVLKPDVIIPGHGDAFSPEYQNSSK